MSNRLGRVRRLEKQLPKCRSGDRFLAAMDAVAAGEATPADFAVLVDRNPRVVDLFRVFGCLVVHWREQHRFVGAFWPHELLGSIVATPPDEEPPREWIGSVHLAASVSRDRRAAWFDGHRWVIANLFVTAAGGVDGLDLRTGFHARTDGAWSHACPRGGLHRFFAPGENWLDSPAVRLALSPEDWNAHGDRLTAHLGPSSPL